MDKKEVLLTVYPEVVATLKAIDDFRGKILSLLPLASGAAGIVLLNEWPALNPFLIPIGVFGLLITIGLYIYEIRNLNLCDDLLCVGKKLEENTLLELEESVRPITKWAKRGTWFRWASHTIFVTVLIGWAFVIAVGACPDLAKFFGAYQPGAITKPVTQSSSGLWNGLA